MSEYTPGPWELCKLPPASWTYIQDQNHEVVASVGEWTSDGKLNKFHGNRGVEEAKANAQLIAAAPDLLDALEGLIDFCDGLDSQHGIDDYFLGGDDFYQNYKTIFEKAIKARDKAKRRKRI